MSKSLEGMTLRGRLLLGGVFAGVGLLIVAMVTGSGSFEPDMAEAPEWLGVLAGGLFVLVGAWIFARETPLQPALDRAVGPLVLMGLLTISHWVAFGPGARECTGSLSIPFISSWVPVGGLQCRWAFAAGALFFDGVLGGMLLSNAADRWLEGTPHKVVDGLGKAMILLVLSPLIIPLLGISLVKALGEKLLKRG